VRVTLLEQHNYHLFQPLLYQLATGLVQPADIAHPVRAIVRRHRRTSVRMATVSAVDLEARQVLTEEGGRFPYDFLVLAAGATTATFGIPGVEEHSFPLKSMPDALRLRAHLLHQFELAENDPSQIGQGALTVVVVGGGPTGVEMAGALHELFKHVLVHDFPDLDIHQARVVLLEAMDHLLAPFHPSSRGHALEILSKRGVEVRLGQALERATPNEVILKDGTVIPTRTLIWGAGVRAHPLADVLGLEQTRGGRIVVGEDLSVPGRPEVFVVGDLAGAPDGKGGLQPQVAQPAIQEARHAAQNIERTLKGEPRTPFEYHDKGTMATIGRNAAVTELPSGARFKGALAWYMWLALHLAYIIGFRSRVAVLVNWIWSYLTYDRHARIIVAVEGNPPRALEPPRPAAQPASAPPRR
ncbi:MAG TPA: NAD(P)/FAD-dependent oxidoreductase, partial [Actinomycetes bacterium]|nr:NAD(P)/FAD-dependent oxidoreductase [Actinomycetes bacterium]